MNAVPAGPLFQLVQLVLLCLALQGAHHPVPTPGLQHTERKGAGLNPTPCPSFSQESQPESCTTSHSYDGSVGGSALQDGSQSEGEGEAGSDGGSSDSGGSSDEESSGSSRSGSKGATEDKGIQQDGLDNEGEGSSSETEGSDSGSGSSSSESDNAENQPKATS